MRTSEIFWISVQHLFSRRSKNDVTVSHCKISGQVAVRIARNYRAPIHKQLECFRRVAYYDIPACQQPNL